MRHANAALRPRLARFMAVLVAACLALVLCATPAAVAGPVLPATPSTCDGVWVVVDATALGGETTTTCATSHDTGLDALASAGFEYTQQSGGFLTRIDGLPRDGKVAADHYWSYWQASRTASDEWSAWEYAQLGPASSQPRTGEAEGWRFVTTDSSDPPPPATSPPSTSPTTATDTPADSTATPRGASSATRGGPAGILVTVGIVAVAAVALGVWRVRKGRAR